MILHNITFVEKMDAFFQEHPYTTVDDLKKIWEDEYREEVIDVYFKARNWEHFSDLILGLIEDSQEETKERLT